jgi:hypothetical protein
MKVRLVAVAAAEMVGGGGRVEMVGGDGGWEAVTADGRRRWQSLT